MTSRVSTSVRQLRTDVLSYVFPQQVHHLHLQLIVGGAAARLIILWNANRADLSHIVEIQLDNLRRLLTDRKIDLRLSDAAKDWLANMGYDPVYGVRSLKHTNQRSVQNPLALESIGGEFTEGDTIDVEADHEGLYLESDKDQVTP